MCNEARRQIALGELRTDWGETRIPLRFPEGQPNMAPLDSVRITDPTVIIRASSEAPGEAELVTRRWSWPGPSGKPVYNFRSEGRSFSNRATQGRCLIPVSGFYEFTAPTDPKQKRKTKWLFSWPEDEGLRDWFCIAGQWRVVPPDLPGPNTAAQAFTMLTTEPGPDVAPYHSRQVVLLPRRHWGDWIMGSMPSADLIQPLPAGTLRVEQVA